MDVESHPVACNDHVGTFTGIEKAVGKIFRSDSLQVKGLREKTVLCKAINKLRFGDVVLERW